ncbi:MAG: SRPBCC family protein [Bacteroidota bacterium]|nr:SRPBCC family protein [Bacteroidota bacterium]
MKILKITLLVIVGIISLLLITALFVKKEYAIEREVTIDKPKQEVFDYVKLIKNQDNYSVWNMKDPNMKKEFKGTDGTVGFVSAWESENSEVGQGEQEIKKITEGERLDMELRFKKPFEATDDAYMTTESAGDKTTKVKWGFKGKMSYPMNIMLLFMNMEDMLGNDLKAGLDNLKKEVEK